MAGHGRQFCTRVVHEMVNRGAIGRVETINAMSVDRIYPNVARMQSTEWEQSLSNLERFVKSRKWGIPHTETPKRNMWTSSSLNSLDCWRE